MSLEEHIDETYWYEVQMWGSDRVRAEAYFDHGSGWRWQLSQFDDVAGWDMIDGGVQKSAASAIASLADAILDLAHGWAF